MKKYVNFAILFLGFLALSACGGILSPVGFIAEQQKDLIITSFLLMLIVIIPVILLSIILPVIYREKNKKKPDYKPEWAHSTVLEAVWWGIPIVIIFMLAVITWKTSHSLDPYKPLDSDKKPVRIQVVAMNWKWLFVYPEHNIATVNFIQVPKDTPVTFELTSDGPMNSFWIPQVAGQIYAMAAMSTKLHVIVEKEGEYQGMSANYSGEGFSQMKFVMKVSSEEEFNNFIKDTKNTSNVLNSAEYNKLVMDSINNPVVLYGNVEGAIFEDAIMKYVDPNSLSGGHGGMAHNGSKDHNTAVAASDNGHQNMNHDMNHDMNHNDADASNVVSSK